MTPQIDGIAIEPERYELIDAIAAGEWTRRQFFGITGAGLIVALLAGDEASAQQPQRGGQRGGGGPPEIGGWVHIGADGAVTAYTGKVEVGQNVRTSLAQAVADELRVPLKSVKMVMADTALVPYDYDFFKIDVPKAETLEVTIEFDTFDGDMDLFLVNEDIQTIAS
ncbi:MAG: molybdopterin cofactor-binding domain-containing protein, partial [Gemmataceae bacterium]